MRDRHAQSAGRYERRRLRLLAERASGAHVLDVGCAQMWNPGLLQPGRRVTGLDLAANPEAGYDRYLVGNVFDLERLAPGERFDCVVAGEFVEHVEQPYELLRLFARVLVPGGRLVLSTPNPMGFPVNLFEWSVAKSRFYTADHTYYFAPRWMARVLERCGFRVDEIAGVGLWPLGLPCPVGVSYQVVYVASRA